MKQKKMIIFIVIVLIAIIKFLYTIVVNDSFIKKYSNGEYDEEQIKKLLVLNIQEPYIAHYNYGNALYQNKNYNDAKSEYEEALKTVTNERVCDVRVNLALTKLNLIDENLSSDEIIKKINEIQKVLTENNCASSSGNGDDKKAQDLYDYLEDLKNSQSQNGDGPGEGGNGDEPTDPDGEVIENEADKVNQIKQRRQQSSESRNPANDVDYDIDYDGVVW